mmetsp:Transcript_10316/g.41690  ORF Transcript_10316/g.41690 Transcript_10316/m.41690 type:complete len:268 (-) Transcript_10316:794-1597(-)
MAPPMSRPIRRSTEPIVLPALSVISSSSSALAETFRPRPSSAPPPLPPPPTTSALASIPFPGVANTRHASACGSRYPRSRHSLIPSLEPSRTRSRGGSVARSANGRHAPASCAAFDHRVLLAKTSVTLTDAASAAARRARTVSHTARASSSLGVARITSHRRHVPTDVGWLKRPLRPLGRVVETTGRSRVRIDPGHRSHGAVPPPHTRHWHLARALSLTRCAQSSPHHPHHAGSVLVSCALTSVGAFQSYTTPRHRTHRASPALAKA